MPNWTVRLVGPESKAFAQAFALAKQNYRYFYQAELLNPAENYLVFEEFEQHSEQSGKVKACMSCTGASQERSLFSEMYLDQAIEKYIEPNPERERIMEIGSLASIGDPYSTLHLIRASTVLTCFQHKWEYALITITPVVEKLLNDCQIVYRSIAKADIEKLPKEQHQQWGSYYQQNPKVCIIDVKSSLYNHLNSLVDYPELSISVAGIRS